MPASSLHQSSNRVKSVASTKKYSHQDHNQLFNPIFSHVLAAERSAPKMNTILLIKNATRSACYLLIASRNSSEVYFALFIITPAPSAGRQAVRVNFEWHFWEIAYRSRTFSTRWAAGELRVSARVFHALAVKSAQGAREKKKTTMTTMPTPTWHRQGTM